MLWVSIVEQFKKLEAARNRNTNTCLFCKRHHQKCDNRDGYPCRRCKEKKYPCEVNSPPPPSNVATSRKAGMESSTQKTRPTPIVTEGRLIVPHLGRILYVYADRTSDGYSTVLFQPIAGNTHHILQVTCDDEYNATGKAKYLCTESEWARNSERFAL